MEFNVWPAFNAGLNAISALFLLSGYFFIRRKNIYAHQMSMTGALLVTSLFLVSYIVYHYTHGMTRFPSQGPVRFVYFSILISHTILAVTLVPLVIRTLLHAITGRIEKHKHLARITFPIWLYVSITGVIVYLMLYHLPRT